MKHMRLLGVFICVLLLSACNTDNTENKDPKQVQEKTISINLNTEDEIKEYLVGDWYFEDGYKTDISCKMNIDQNLNIKLQFEDLGTGESKGKYSGQIKLDRLYANSDQPPDIISVNLTDIDSPGGDFFFKHRTIYDEKRLMSWFFAGNGDSIFDILGPEDFKDIPEEIMFEKISGEITQFTKRKNDEFYATFWGLGSDDNILWIDDVWWTPPEEGHSSLLPLAMTTYENDIKESLLYSIRPDNTSDILGDDLFKGEVYFVQTDKNGNIISFISAEYKRYLEEISDGVLDYEIKQTIFDVIDSDVEEIRDHLNAGMSVFFDEETITIEGEECYLFNLGTNHEEQFVREILYAMSMDSHQVYRYDVLTDKWEAVAMG